MLFWYIQSKSGHTFCKLSILYLEGLGENVTYTMVMPWSKLNIPILDFTFNTHLLMDHVSTVKSHYSWDILWSFHLRPLHNYDIGLKPLDQPLNTSFKPYLYLRLMDEIFTFRCRCVSLQTPCNACNLTRKNIYYYCAFQCVFYEKGGSMIKYANVTGKHLAK